MTEDTKLKLIVAGAGIAVAAVATGITAQVRKRRRSNPLPGTTKIEKFYVVHENAPTK